VESSGYGIILRMTFAIENMQESDWDAVRGIYEEGIATGNATFETTVPTWAKWDASHLESPRLVCRSDEGVSGWAALTPVSGRCVYSGVAEVSVYVAANHRGKGIGLALLQSLIAESERVGIWTLQAGILTENQASIAVHEKAGFRIVGTRERLGKLNRVWRDVLLLERRSTIVGVG